jgi:MHS family shikimate/dehydroshikimate transporter-like MFS transporter
MDAHTSLAAPMPARGDAIQSLKRTETRSLMILAFAATSGVLVEFYDFTIFGFAAATAFPGIFFPNVGATHAMAFSYVAYAAGYPARLLGAFLFGHFGDRAGRKGAFLANILVVGGATCLTGLLPGYATLGILSPVLLVTLRFVQGVGVGGEIGATTSLLSEFGADRRSRAFWTSLANLGLSLGVMIASGVLLALNRTFSTTGWRVAMLLSAVIAVPAIVARYQLTDSPIFVRIKERQQLAMMPSLAVLREHALPIGLLSIVLAFMMMDSVVVGTYAISFMRLAGVSLATTATVVLLSRVGDVAGLIVSGPLADLFTRRRLAGVAITLTMLLSWPATVVILDQRIPFVMLTQFLIGFLGIGILHGLAPILASEHFPTKLRYSGVGLVFSVAGLLGGMTAPPLLAALIGQDIYRRWGFLPLVYVIYGMASIVALRHIPETRGLSLADLDSRCETPNAS